MRKINTNYLDKLALTTQITHKKNQINYQHGRLLYGYLYNLIKLKKLRFINIFENVTARGFSSICMSRARIATKIKGKIDTIDILPHNQKMMWNGQYIAQNQNLDQGNIQWKDHPWLYKISLIKKVLSYSGK